MALNLAWLRQGQVGSMTAPFTGPRENELNVNRSGLPILIAYGEALAAVGGLFDLVDKRHSIVLEGNAAAFVRR